MSSQFLFLLSFLEGGMVMAVELLGAKMLAPFFGVSLYVWTTTLAMTLGALTSGYFVGGNVSRYSQKKHYLLCVLLLASALTLAMPLTASILLPLLVSLPLFMGLLIAGFLCIFPPVFCFGMVSPLVIAELSQSKYEAGRAAGLVYAISTLGGILFTFFYGFWLIPVWGLYRPAVFSGFLMALLPGLALLRRLGTGFVLLGLIIWGVIGIGLIIFTSLPVNAKLKILMFSEGLLGQVLVLEDDGVRVLMVNRVIQTEWKIKDKYRRYSPYAHLLAETATYLPQRGKALVLGLGGGAISQLLLQQANFKTVETCELDERIYQAARQHFNLDPRIRVIVDDARHFLNQVQTRYDLIVFDLFRGEESPEHVLTLENLRALQARLTTQGAIIINSHGYVHGLPGRGNRAIFETLRQAGYYVRWWGSSEHEETSNLLFLATPKSGALSLERIPLPLESYPLSPPAPAPELVLSDAQPRLNVFNISASLAWRRAALRTHPYYQKYQIPLFR